MVENINGGEKDGAYFVSFSRVLFWKSIWIRLCVWERCSHQPLDLQNKLLVSLNYTISGYKIGQRCEVIFIQDDDKNHCIAFATELFFEEILEKKNE